MSPAARHDAQRIGPTAHYTAYVWRRVGLPHAEHFATPTGALLYWGFFALGEWATRLSPAVPSMREFLEYRHRLIDAVVRALEPDCVVELGAGLTRRAITWAADHGVDAIELDLPGMAAIKRQRVQMLPAELRARLRDRHEIHELDVLDPQMPQRLAAWIGARQRPVVIAEGLLSYFDLEPRRALIAAVGRALAQAGGGYFVCDLHTARAQAQVGWAAQALRTAIRGLTRRRQALSPFADWPAVHDAFMAAGFERCAQAHAEDYLHLEPRLTRLHSPAHIVVARHRA